MMNRTTWKEESYSPWVPDKPLPNTGALTSETNNRDSFCSREIITRQDILARFNRRTREVLLRRST